MIILEPANYVVIGAFSVFKNAVNFTSQASKLNLDAKYIMNRNRNLYYVYVLNTADHQQAIEEALRLRKESPFNDTWVFHGELGQSGAVSKGTDINPEAEQKIENVPSNDNQVIAESTPEPEVLKEKTTPAEIVGKGFFFKLFRSDNKEQVSGEVSVIDVERTRKMGTFSGNVQVGVADPKNKEGKISLVCEVFGYRKMLRDITYNAPEGEDIQVDESNTTIVPFELVRLKKGDIAVMYNVFFYKDAGVMRPESKEEVTSLLTMLQENPKCKIRIHGHTNGDAPGRIISLNEGNENYFALNDAKDGLGSAKELSEARAEVLRNFLVSNDVPTDRMQIKAWGGKRAIHDKHSPQAQSNVRVEIEILEN